MRTRTIRWTDQCVFPPRRQRGHHGCRWCDTPWLVGCARLIVDDCCHVCSLVELRSQIAQTCRWPDSLSFSGPACPSAIPPFLRRSFSPLAFVLLFHSRFSPSAPPTSLITLLPTTRLPTLLPPPPEYLPLSTLPLDKLVVSALSSADIRHNDGTLQAAVSVWIILLQPCYNVTLGWFSAGGNSHLMSRTTIHQTRVSEVRTSLD